MSCKRCLHILSVVLLIQCGSNPVTQSDNVIRVNPDEVKDLPLNEIISDLHIVPLEVTDESYVQTIEKLTVHGERIFLIPDRQRSSVLVFDIQGSLVKRFSNRGPGPGQYTRIDDFHVWNQDIIEILDSRSLRLMRYDLREDSLMDVKRVPFLADRFTRNSRGELVFYKNAKAGNNEDESYFYKVIVTNSDLNVLARYKPFMLEDYRAYHSLTLPSPVINRRGRIFLNSWGSDTLYSVSADTLAEELILDFGKRTRPEGGNFRSAQQELEAHMSDNNRYVLGTHYLSETGTHRTLQFVYASYPYVLIINKETGHLVAGRRIVDREEGNVPIPPPFTNTNEHFVSYWTPQFVEEFKIMDLNGSNPYRQAIEEIFREGGNPVLFLYKFKT